MKNSELKVKDKKEFAIFKSRHHHTQYAHPERVQEGQAYKARLYDDQRYNLDQWDGGHHGVLPEGTVPHAGLHASPTSKKKFGRAVEFIETRPDGTEMKRHAIVKTAEIVGEWEPIEKRWKKDSIEKERRDAEEAERRRIDQINHEKAQESYRIESESIKEAVDKILNKSVRLSTNLESVRKADGTYARYTAVTISAFDLQRLIEMVYEARENAVA